MVSSNKSRRRVCKEPASGAPSSPIRSRPVLDPRTSPSPFQRWRTLHTRGTRSIARAPSPYLATLTPPFADADSPTYDSPILDIELAHLPAVDKEFTRIFRVVRLREPSQLEFGPKEGEEDGQRPASVRLLLARGGAVATLGIASLHRSESTRSLSERGTGRTVVTQPVC